MRLDFNLASDSVQEIRSFSAFISPPRVFRWWTRLLYEHFPNSIVRMKEDFLFTRVRMFKRETRAQLSRSTDLGSRMSNKPSEALLLLSLIFFSEAIPGLDQEGKIQDQSTALLFKDLY